MSSPRATCPKHGLVYDPMQTSGCVICRREEGVAPNPNRVGAILAGAGLTVVVLVAVGAMAGGGMFGWRFAQRQKEAEVAAKEDTAQRETRQAPISVVPMSAAPSGPPLVGDEGRDDDGYPIQVVDPTALRSALHQRRFAELTAYLEGFQDSFEKDPTLETWPAAAAHAFRSAEPEIEPELDAWASATPKSFAPYLARGAHWSSVAAAARGGKWASKTSEASFEAMRVAGEKALVELDRALALRPHLVAAQAAKMHIQITLSHGAGERESLARALALCPTCFIPRVEHLRGLEPRWGGSYDAMDAFARSAPVASNRRLRVLAAYADLDRADWLRGDKKLDDASAAIERALAVCQCSEFLLERAKLEYARNDLEHALGDLDRAARRNPFDADIIGKRADVELDAKRYEAAGRDLLTTLRVDPTDAVARRIFDDVVKGLQYQGYQYFKAGRHQDALRLYDLAMEIAPTREDVRGQREQIVAAIAAGHPSPSAADDDLAAAQKAADDAPDDFVAHRKLDDALARRGDFARVVEMWNEYLGRHPNDGLAYLERGGAYLHLRDANAAHGDAKRACDLGVSDGCKHAKEMEPRPGAPP
jgi:tetratricopeptide (TPR) repeat protein